MNDSDKPETLGEFLLRTLDSQSPEEIPEEIEKLSREHYIKMHDRELDELLKQPGYGFSMGMHFYEALERLSEQQLTFINALCIFQYYEYFVPHAWVVNHAANQIIGGLSTGKLSPDFTLSELKAFIIRHNIELRDDWKTRLELLESAGIESETTHITPGAGPGTSTKPASSPKGNAKGDISGFFGIRGLAQRNNIPDYKYAAFEKAVRRWQNDNPESSAVQETTNRNPNQDKWIYKEDVLMHIIKKYQVKD